MSANDEQPPYRYSAKGGIGGGEGGGGGGEGGGEEPVVARTVTSPASKVKSRADVKTGGNIKVRVSGVGAYLPRRIITNAELATRLDTSDEWIRTRTGIRQRHIAADDEQTSDLALHAARDAFARAGISTAEMEARLDAIVLATTSPDNTFPATATRLHHKLGLRRAIPCYDIQAVCAGFVFALHSAWNMLLLGQARCVLVVGAEIYSRSILDWSDRNTCVLFGDGAGAFILEARDSRAVSDSSGSSGSGAPDKLGEIIDIMIASDGAFYDLLYVDGGAGSSRDVGRVRMNGSVVFREGIEKMSSSVTELLARNDLCVDDISFLVPHQANQRIMDGVGRRLGLDSSRIVSTVGEHGNISAATIPAALSTACADGRVKRGDLIAITAMGGGFSWGGALIRW